MSLVPKGSFLLVTDGPVAGHTVPLKERLIIGRSSQCDLALAGTLISRLHAEICYRDNQFEVRDLGSANGTYVNDELVNRALLSDGDTVRIGESSLTLQIADSSPYNDLMSSQVVMRQTRSGTDSSKVFMPGEANTLQTSMMGDDLIKAGRAQQRLHSLVEISQTLGRLRKLEALYPLVLDEAMKVIPASRGALVTVDPVKGIVPQAARNSEQAGATVELSQSVLNEVIDKQACIMSPDAVLDDQIAMSDSIMDLDIRAVLAVPITYEGEVLGALYMDAPGKDDMFSEEDLHFLSGVGGLAAVAITNARSLHQVRSSADELNRAYLSMLSVMANAIEARDHYTIGHTWRVARFAQAMARRLGWDEKTLNEIEVGGVLHDIGKIGVPDSILTKPAPLDDREIMRMKFHPQIGARMLHDVPSLQYALPYILYHHERYDGKGYPEGLKGEEIPTEARLLGVADALDAMTSDRPYRKGLDPDVAMGEIERNAGKQFDPLMVDALIQAYEANELTPYMQSGEQGGKELFCPFCSTSFDPAVQTVDEQEMVCPTCKRKLVLFNEDGYYYATLV